MTDQSKQNHQAVLRKMQAARKAVLEEIGKVVVGQREPLEQLLTALFAGGHCVIQGPPATAKTIMVDSLARVMSLDFRRIQFTPDLMPADISGTEILEEDQATGQRVLRFVKGPVFCNILMADEINRTPPKTQAALLEVMQEKQVTLGGRTTPLPKPFYVLATQVTLEHEGTYPLPEAQQDRFMFLVQMDYLGEDQEVEAVRRSTGARPAELRKLLGGEDLLEFQNAVRDVALPPELSKYIVALVDTSRPTRAEAPDFVKDYVYWGAGLRASQYLSLGAKSRAAQDGRVTVTAADIRGVIAPVLRHRIGLSFRAEVDGVSVDEVIRRLAEAVPAPDGK
jgi:MoxR-like ATPase